MALVRKDLGLVYYETGRTKEALEQYRIAESLASGTDEDNLQLRVSIHISQALYHNGRGDYSNSIAFNNEALRLLDSVPIRDGLAHKKKSAILLNKGIALFHLGNYKESLKALKESEQIKESHDLQYLGSVYFNLARVYDIMENPELSGLYYGMAVHQWVSEYDSTSYELANIYLYFGQFLTSHGDKELGIKYLQNALLNYKKNYGPIHPLTAGCYEKIATYFLVQSDYNKALDYLQLALHSISADFGGRDIHSNPEVGTSSHDLTLLRILATKAKTLYRASDNLTEMAEKMKFLKSALATNSLSIAILRQIRNSFLSRESRIYLTSQQKDLFTTGIRLNLKLFQLTGEKKYKEEAFLVAARGKASSLLYEMKEKEWLYLESMPDSLSRATLEMKQQIETYSNLIQEENLRVRPDTVKLRYWQKNIFQSRDIFARQMEKLAVQYPKMGHFDSFDPGFSIKQLRQKLGRRENLVEYFVSNDQQEGRSVFIFVVTRRDCQFYQARIDSSFYGDLEVIRHNLHEFDPNKESLECYNSLNTSLHSVYQQFFQPVESRIIGKKIVLVPDEELAFLPFDALITRYSPETILNYAGLDYLLNKYNISYVSNSLLLETVRSRRFLLPKILAWVPAYQVQNNSDSLALKGASEEVRKILELVKGKSFQGTPDKNLAKRYLEADGIIHLAMHASSGHAESVSPYFLLAPQEDTFINTRLYDYEINGMSISSPMVVLSSCRTAGGDLQSGEGILSLSRSFLLAGAKSVIHTLWPVADARGPDLMVEYYRQLKRGRSKSIALTNAKKKYLVHTSPSYTHPYYWATYQVTGNPVPLRDAWREVMISGLILLISVLGYYSIRRSFRSRI